MTAFAGFADLERQRRRGGPTRAARLGCAPAPLLSVSRSRRPSASARKRTGRHESERPAITRPADGRSSASPCLRALGQSPDRARSCCARWPAAIDEVDRRRIHLAARRSLGIAVRCRGMKRNSGIEDSAARRVRRRGGRERHRDSGDQFAGERPRQPIDFGRRRLARDRRFERRRLRDQGRAAGRSGRRRPARPQNPKFAHFLIFELADRPCRPRSRRHSRPRYNRAAARSSGPRNRRRAPPRERRRRATGTGKGKAASNPTSRPTSTPPNRFGRRGLTALRLIINSDRAAKGVDRARHPSFTSFRETGRAAEESRTRPDSRALRRIWRGSTSISSRSSWSRPS